MLQISEISPSEMVESDLKTEKEFIDYTGMLGMLTFEQVQKNRQSEKKCDLLIDPEKPFR